MSFHLYISLYRSFCVSLNISLRYFFIFMFLFIFLLYNFFHEYQSLCSFCIFFCVFPFKNIKKQAVIEDWEVNLDKDVDFLKSIMGNENAKPERIFKIRQPKYAKLHHS